MLSKARAAIGALAVAAVVAAGSVAAAPQAQAGSSFYGAQVHQVGGKKNYWNNRYRNNYRPRYYNNGWNNNWWVGPAIGFGAGVLLGSALTAPRYYAPSAPRYYGDRNAYCARKYRSYNPYSGTYTGYDGRQHYCRIP
jgi:BA14K-like protein